jgi:hypothetical protein
MCQALRFGAQGAAAAFTAAQYTQGAVTAVLGDRTITFPATGPTSTTYSGAWLAGFAMAAVCRDRVALEILCKDNTVFALQGSSTQGDKFWLLLLLALASLVRGDMQRWQERATEARLLMAPSALRIADPVFVTATKLPLLDLGELLSTRNTTGWDEAVGAALEKHRFFWGSGNNQYDYYGFLAFETLGLCCLAHDQGISTSVQSPYLPLALIEGQCGSSSSQVTYTFPTMPARSVNEAHLFMDLHDCAPGNREHRLITRDGKLLAVYRGTHVQGGETLEVQFELSAAEVPAAAGGFVIGGAAPSTLLDAGEFLWLADQLAEAVPAHVEGLAAAARSAARLHLEKAIACLDEILKFIPPGATRVPDHAFWTPRGRAVLQTEPGRFEAARLRAVQASYEKLLAAMGAPRSGAAPGPPVSAASAPQGGEAAMRTSALASIELIRAQVTPILEALARDHSGETVQLLRPHPDDYARVFVGAAVEVARQTYEAMWNTALNLAYPSSEQTVLLCYVAPAGMLADDNELSRHFPGGYKAIAPWLNPHRVWVCWKYVRPGETSGLAYNGLVWCDDHWAWLPKPYTVLRGLRPNH